MKTSEFKARLTKGILATIKQGKRSIMKTKQESSCLYKHGKLKCVVGHMMTPQELRLYKNELLPVDELHEIGFLPNITKKQLEVLSELQGCHDNNEEPISKYFRKVFIEDIKKLNNRTINTIIKENNL